MKILNNLQLIDKFLFDDINNIDKENCSVK